MLIQYSGLIASAFAVFFIAIPTIFAKYNRKKYPISFLGTMPFWSLIFNIGAIMTGTFQLIFIIHLNSLISNYNSTLGAAITAIGAVSCIFIGFFPYNKNRKVHIIFALGFFLLNSIGALIFSLSIGNTNYIFPFFELLSLVFVFKILKETGFAELLGILFSVLWAVSFYLIH